MGIVADALGAPVVRAKVLETTSLGAAYAAGLVVGFWPDLATLSTHWREDGRWSPQITDEARALDYARWKKAVALTLGWAP
jgi:glycerol kinase